MRTSMASRALRSLYDRSGPRGWRRSVFVVSGQSSVASQLSTVNCRLTTWELAPGRVLEGGQGRAPRPGHVQVGHEGEARHARLLLAQRRVVAHLPQEPLAELARGLHDASAHEI